MWKKLYSSGDVDLLVDFDIQNVKFVSPFFFNEFASNLQITTAEPPQLTLNHHRTTTNAISYSKRQMIHPDCPPSPTIVHTNRCKSPHTQATTNKLSLLHKLSILVQIN